MYVDVSYYVNEFKGAYADPSEIEKALKAAEVRIDELTFGRIRARGFDNLTEFQKRCIREAVCYQTEYYEENGYDGTVSSYSVPDISISVKSSENEASSKNLSPLTLSLLNQSGLAVRRL